MAKARQIGRRNRRGVTIVEFMMVLVIMGLLLGGILKGQELVNNAKVKKIAYNFNSIHTAYASFVDRYRAVPGDFRQASGYLDLSQVAVDISQINGNGNGVIEGGMEGALALNHLSSANLFICPVCRGIYGEAVSASNSPVNPYGGLFGLYAASALDFYEFPDTGREPILKTVAHTGAFIPVAISAEIDLKLDDGLPFSGAYRLSYTSPRGAPTDGANCLLTGTLHPNPNNAGLQSQWNINANYTNCPGVMIF